MAYRSKPPLFSLVPLIMVAAAPGFLPLGSLGSATFCPAQDSPPLTLNQLTQQQRETLKRHVTDAFAEVHDGWSSDEVILQRELNDAFLDACRQRMTGVDDEAFNWSLLNLRKAGKLPLETTRRDTRDYSGITHIAEMAARTLEDKYGLSTDRIMANPKYREEFDQATARIVEGVDPYLFRKAAFRLRKTRLLKPELITRVADWDRVVSEHAAEELTEDVDPVPRKPGVYIFRDATGYLYIGEAADLRERLRQHMNESDRKSLAHYMKVNGRTGITVEVHAFDPDSRAKEVMVRRAYESELIRSRQPRFNIRP